MATARAGKWMRLMTARLVIPILCLGIVNVLAVKSSANTPEQQFFEGLRERGLFLIAEDYAVSRLNSDRLLPDERARITVELAHTLIEHGATSPQEQRHELWDEANQLLQEFITANPLNPRLPEVQGELFLLPARRAEILIWDAEVNPANRQAEQFAQQQCQTAVKSLSQFLSTLTAQRPLTESELADGVVSQEELQDLQREAEYLHAKTTLFLARLTNSGPNRAGLLLDVTKQLDQLSKSRPETIWSFQAKLLLARMARLEEDYRRAEILLRSLDGPSENYSREDEVLAEQVRVQLDQGRIDTGLQLVTERLRQSHRLSSEVRAVAVTGLLSAWKIAGEKEKPDLQKELLEEAQRHHELTQGKWQQFTYYKLQEAQQAVHLGDELAQLIRTAQWNYHEGELDKAMELYGSAAALAHRQQKSDLAVEYAFTAGSIEIQRKKWTSAAKLFGEVVKQFPQHRRAADAGLMQCFALGQIYLTQPAQDTRENYEAALQQFRKQFSKEVAAIEATWMQATHEEQRLQWTDAIALYREIPPDHSRYDAAILRIVILYEKILTRLRELQGPLQDWEDQLLKEIVHIEEHFPQHDVLRSFEQCQTSLRVALLLLQHRDRWYSVADHWLRRIEQTVDYQRREASLRSTSIDAEWLQIERTAAQLRIVSLAGQEKLEEARQIMLRLQQTDPTTMLGLLLGLTEMSSKVDPRRQVELGHLQLEAIQRLSQSRDQLTPQQQRMLDTSHAEAFIAIGNLPEAAEIYESLLKHTPRDENLIRKVIAVLIQRGQSSDLQRARTWWTKVESLHPAGTVVWIESRLNIARLDSRLGKVDQARKLLGVTKALYPNLGTPALEAEFLAFQAELTGK